jgi:BNR repeat-like domain
MRRPTYTSRLKGLTVALALGVPVVLLAQQVADVAPVSSDPYTNAGSQHATQVEPAMFANGAIVVAAFQSGRYRAGGGASNTGWATSHDGGATWMKGFLPALTVNSDPLGPYARATDPSVAHDGAHGVWMIASLVKQKGRWGAVVVSRSTDEGLTWGAPVVVSSTPAGGYDKSWIACDDWPSSPFYGHCYVTWDEVNLGDRIRMSTSADGGLTWSPKTSPAGNPTGLGGIPTPQPDGRVIVPASDAFGTHIIAFHSDDGGLSWGNASVVSSVISHRVAGGLRALPSLHSTNVDAAGQVYVVWADCRFRPQCSANDLVMSASSDGMTWSPVVRIPIDPIDSGVDHFIPGLAVDRSTSGSTARLALTYYYYPSARCTSATCRLHVGFVASPDGGATWTEPETLAGPMNLSWLPRTTGGRMVGDYISTSLVGTTALSPFAVAHENVGRVFDEAINVARISVAAATASRRARSVASDPVLSTQSDRPSRTRPIVTP